MLLVFSMFFCVVFCLKVIIWSNFKVCVLFWVSLKYICKVVINFGASYNWFKDYFFVFFEHSFIFRCFFIFFELIFLDIFCVFFLTKKYLPAYHWTVSIRLRVNPRNEVWPKFANIWLQLFIFFIVDKWGSPRGSTQQKLIVDSEVRLF